jgi:hypothetical protein
MTVGEKLSAFKYERDLENKEFQEVLAAITRGETFIAINGRAGTGKSTFIKDFSAFCTINAIKLQRLAFTGIAAKNINGSTIHSYFDLDIRPYLPTESIMEHYWNDYSTYPGEAARITSTGERIRIKLSSFGHLAGLELFFRIQWQTLANLDVLIFDEVSMIRCDTLDVCDLLMRRARSSDAPFGGCLVLFFGDLVQLPPVVSESDRKVLEVYYQEPFGYKQSDVVQRAPPFEVELETIYRQRNDKGFIKLLDAIRHDGMMPTTIEELNKRVKEFIDWKRMDYSTQIICCANARATTYNEQLLSLIDLPEKVYEANVHGDLLEHEYTPPKTLKLKVGAKVMLIKNNKKEGYVNGDMGIVLELHDDHIIVGVSGQLIQVRREYWDIEEHEYVEGQRRVSSKSRGGVQQFPIRLAWAITVHKSQGQTFDNILCDLRDTFVEGHEYVALSRATSLKGVTMLAPIGGSE